MKKSIVSVFMLTLFWLLSCDFDAISELIDKASTKLSDRNKNIENLKYRQEEQNGHKVVEDKYIENSIKNLGDESKTLQVIQEKPELSVNSINGIPVMIPNKYPLRRAIEIKESDLVSITKEEKEAEEAIKNIEYALKGSKFSLLIKEAQDLKTKSVKMSTDLQDLYENIQGKMELLGTDFRNKKENRQELNRLQNGLKNEIFNLEKLISKIDIAIGERRSAKALFEKAQETLKQSIIKRLEKAANVYLVRADMSTNLCINAIVNAESSLEQLASSASKIGEAIGLMKDTEKIIRDVKFSLARLDK